MFAYNESYGSAVTEQAAVLALVRRSRAEWYQVAQLLELTGSALLPARGERTGFEPDDLLRAVELPVPENELEEAQSLIDALAADGVGVVTVLDDSYPTNLRLIYNRPPFLFVRGELRSANERSIAVVGTRRASDEGRDLARRMAEELVAHDVTVLSGLALGIDGAAHEGALSAHGRTVAVVGTGIRRMYPKENASLADQIVSSGGAIVSQFLPDAPPTKWSFPLRNVTMSGMAVGTVVVEASGHSGARNQARRALEHGKRLFLMDRVVDTEDWAQRYAERPGTMVVSSAAAVVSALEEDLRASQRQLTLT